MTPEQAIKFMEEMAQDFECKAANTQEDMHFWAYQANAESCRKIARLISLLDEEGRSLEGRNGL